MSKTLSIDLKQKSATALVFFCSISLLCSGLYFLLSDTIMCVCLHYQGCHLLLLLLLNCLVSLLQHQVFATPVFSGFGHSPCVCVLTFSQVLIDLSNTSQLDNTPRWLPLREQSESIEHSRAHHAAQGPPGPGSGHGHGQGHSQGYMSVPGMGQGHGHGLGQGHGQGDGGHDSPKNSVIKSRSHGIFPDPAKGKGHTVFDPISQCSTNHMIQDESWFQNIDIIDIYQSMRLKTIIDIASSIF